ncbi:MAG: DUF58 domain-containing protein [bacterium]
MSVSAYRFIDPHVLAAISNLPLLAKTVVDGFMLGAHQGPQPGAGQEFNQYRSYQPGDDPRRVDWKMYARSDRFYVRESEIETSITIRFILDASASMLHADGELVKFDYARFLIAALGYLAHRQGDAIGLHGVPEGDTPSLLPKRDHQQLHRFLHDLEKLTPSGRWPEWQKMAHSFSTAPGRELIIVVSDLHEHGHEIATALSKLRALKHEVLLFHLLGRNEIDFTYTGEVAFQDLETGQTLPVNTATARAGYRQALQRYLLTLPRKWREQDVAYELLALDRPLDFALRRYLTQRMKLW